MPAPSSPEPFLASLAEALRGRYAIEEEIGRGGMARVYRARDLRHDRDVAIKVLRPELGSMIGGDRFLREIRLTAQLTHPNIIPLLDSGQGGGGELLYFVTPFAAGESLRARLDRERQLPVHDALLIAREIADALDSAHRARIVHRDIKPENVLIVDGHAVVADFGIARALSAASTDTLTATGVSLGTPAYMAPEQVVAAHDLDGRADVYSLGCVLYEMLAGDPPFTGSNAQRVMAQHATSPVASVRLARPGVSESIDRLLEKALQKSPADRYATAGEMRAALDDALSGDSAGRATPRPTAITRTSGARALTLVAGIAAIAVAVVGWLWYRAPRSTAASGDAASNRIAVLPMANLSINPDDRYIADGMTEELISRLSAIASVSVIARSSILGYADTKKPASQIGQELNAGSIVESTCQKIGNKLHITVRLVNAATNDNRWAETYDREASLDNIFDIQREISTTVAQKVSVNLQPADVQRAARRPTMNFDAYGLYVRAQLLFHDRGNNGDGAAAVFDSAATMLEHAIQLDSSFAEAHAALAKVKAAQLFNFRPNDDALRRRASAEIEKALVLDPEMGAAYSARANLEYTREGHWELERSMRDYRRAIALKPNDAEAHGLLGTLLFHVGILDAARRELDIAMTLDPLSRFVPPRIARTMWYAGKYDSALFRMDSVPFARIGSERALILGYLGRAADGLSALDTLLRQSPTDSDFRGARAVMLARLGRRSEAEADIRTSVATGQTASHFHHAEFSIASAYSLMGDADKALRWLERMADDGMPNYALLVNDPSLANVRATPAFQGFLSREKARNGRLTTILEER